jgi:tetratricopeptide (TPR) repeat protein
MNRGRDAREALMHDVDRLPVAGRVQVWIALARLETSQGRPAEARRAYQEWSRLAPDDPRPRLVMMEMAIDQNDEATVRSTVEALRESGGKDDLAYKLAYAKALLWERDQANPSPKSHDKSLQDAKSLIESVISEAPEMPAAQLMKGQIYEHEELPDFAIDCYQRAYERGNDAALPRLVELLVRQKRLDSLAKLRDSARGNTATQIDLLESQAMLRKGDRRKAAEIANRVAKDLPDSPEALGWQAKMFNLMGQFEDAETSLRAMAERQPGALEPWMALLKFQVERKRTQAAAETIGRIKKSVKTDRPDLLQARCLWVAGDRAASDAAFEALLKNKPDDAEGLLLTAKYFEETGRATRAEECLGRVLKNDPKNRPAARQLAVVLSSRPGNTEAWERAWATLGPEDPKSDTPDDRLARAVVLSRSTEPAKRQRAADMLDGLLADLPTTHPIAIASREYLSRLLLDLGQPARASQVASVSAAGGTDPSAIVLFAQALVQSKKPEEAEWQLNRLAAINPGDRREAAMQARVVRDRSRPVQAVSNLLRYYTDRENNPGAEVLGREIFSLLIDMGPDALPSAELLGRSMARKNPRVSWMAASCLGRKSRIDEAYTLLNSALKPKPANLEDVRETGNTAMKIAATNTDPETLRKASEVLDAARKLEPSSDELLVMTAMVRHLQGRFQDEAAIYGELMKHRPEDYVVLNNLAWALSEGLNQPDKGLEFIDRLVKLAGRDPEALDTRGVILTHLGRTDEAIRDLEDVVRRSPSGLHHFHLARAYLAAGRTEDARKAREQVRTAGLSPEGVDPLERPALKQLQDL